MGIQTAEKAGGGDRKINMNVLREEALTIVMSMTR